MNIWSVPWDVIIIWKILYGTAHLYIACIFVFGGYSCYSLVRVFVGLSNLRQRGALARLDRRVAGVRQIILLLLLLFGMTAANEAFRAIPGLRHYSRAMAGDGIDAFGPWTAFIFAMFGALALLHVFQWIVSVRLQQHAADVIG